MKRLLPMLAALVVAAVAHGQELQPSDFSWRAGVDTAGHTGLVRLAIPAEASMQLQTANAADLRLFDAGGRPVAYALATSPATPQPLRARTPAMAALPLHTAAVGTSLPRGATQLRLEEAGERRSVWVQLGSAAPAAAAATRMPAALFDTRAWKQPVSALVLQARLPANVPVRVTLSTSSDLASWTPVAASGRIYRFEGENAPANDVLDLGAPLQLAQQYLRVDWSGQQGVEVESVAGLLQPATPPRAFTAATLGAPRSDGPTALEWQLGFATPIARLELATTQPDTLLPVRILGRNQVSEPWRLLGQGLVYRLGDGTNPPLVLQHPSVRWLRVEATHGLRLQGVPLAARVLFEPVEMVFPAAAAGGYVLAAGARVTAATALPLAILLATSPGKYEDFPQARLVAVQTAPAAPPPAWTAWLPRGVDARTATLWAVLLVGVLVLGGVAWSLLRQLRRKAD